MTNRYFADRGGRGGDTARQAGALYIECGRDTILERMGFEVDPPQRWAGEMISNRGITFTTTPDGISHIVDVVGSEHYPTPADFIEESRMRGISRRISPTLDFSKLTAGKSRIIFLHGKAVIKNLEAFYRGGLERMISALGRQTMVDVCPRARRNDLSHVNTPSAPCIGHHWLIHTANEMGYNRREIGCVSYPVHYLPLTLYVAPEYQLGAIAVAPITGFTLVATPADQPYIDVVARLASAGFRAQITNE